MNHVFSSVWNHSLGAWVAASEHTRRGRQRGRSAARGSDRRANAPQTRIGALQVAVLLACGWLWGTAAHAADLPTGFSAAQNSASLKPDAAPGTMTIQQSGNVSLINWTGFDIAAGNTVTFEMPSARSGSINIISGTTSQIGGNLLSNGNVVLVNTSGIVFQGTSQVNVGGLIATALPPTNAFDLGASAELPSSWEFLSPGSPGGITNHGTITAVTGGVSLIGGSVINTGTIFAASNASLVVGDRVTSFLMQPSIPTAEQPGSWDHSITRTASSAGSWAINNTGTISGSAISLQAYVDNALFSGGINSAGVLQAHGINGGSLVVSTSGTAQLDFGSATTAGSVFATSSHLSTLGALNGVDVTLAASQGEMQLGNINAQALQVNATGSITQASGTGLGVTGASSFTAGGGISLGGAGNVFGGAVSLDGGASQITASGGLRFGILNVNSLIASADTLYLPRSLATMGGQSYSGRLVLEGNTTLTSTLGALAFTGTLEGPHALSLHASGTVYLDAVANIGSLDSTATETQLVADITTLGDIALANTRVIGDVALTSTGGSVQINGSLNGLQDDTDVLSITADGQIALQNAVGNDVRLHDLSLSAGTVSTFVVDVGNRLAIDSIASITQNGAYRVGGTARFASGGDITLLNGGNAFGGDVELLGNNVQISAQGPLSLSGVDANRLQATATDLLTVRNADVAASTTLTGNAVALDGAYLGQTAEVVALGGNITQQGSVRVDGQSRWTAAGNMLLDNDANQLNGAVTAQGNAVSLATAGALDVASVHAAGQAVLRGNGVHLGAVQASGLQVDSGAGITQGSALNLAAASRFTAVDDVLLDNAGNTFAGGVQLAGRNLSIHSAGGLLLNGVDASGNLHATAAAGSLLQSGDVYVQGRSDLLAAGSVQLDRASNRFGGPVAVEGQSILLRAGSGLDMESVRNGSNGAVQLLAAGDIDVAGDAIDTGNSLLSLSSSAGQVRTATALRGGQVSIGGVEGIRIGGDITATTLAMTSTRNDVLQQSGRIQSGNALLSAGQGDLRLTSADNRFNGVTTLYGRDVDLAAGGLLLGEVVASRNLRLDSSGSITQQAQMRVTGTADLRAAGDITLLNAGNRFAGDVALSAMQADIHADQALSLAQVQVDGLQASAVGGLSLRDAAVAGEAVLEGASIVLARADVGTLVATTTAGDLTQSGAITVDSNSQLVATGLIQLDAAANRFGGRVDADAAQVHLAAAGDVVLGDLRATGDIRAQAGANLQLQGHMVADNIDLAAGGLFTNHTGADALQLLGSGRWHIYLASPELAHTYQQLDSGNTAVWNTGAFGSTTATGNRYLFAWQPTLTLQGLSLSKLYGDTVDLAGAYAWSGLMPGVAGAYAADRLADVVQGTPQLSSAGAAAGAQVQDSSYAIDVAAGSVDLSASGYQLAKSSGQLVVDRRPLIITVGDGSKVYGQSTQWGAYTVQGLVLGDTVTALELGSPGLAPDARVGRYAIQVDGVQGSGLGNYDLQFQTGTLQVSAQGSDLAPGYSEAIRWPALPPTEARPVAAPSRIEISQHGGIRLPEAVCPPHLAGCTQGNQP